MQHSHRGGEGQLNFSPSGKNCQKKQFEGVRVC